MYNSPLLACNCLMNCLTETLIPFVIPTSHPLPSTKSQPYSYDLSNPFLRRSLASPSPSPMSSAEPPTIDADAATATAVSFITDLSVESIFAKALIALLLLFFLIRLGYIIVLHVHHRRHNNQTVVPNDVNAQNNNVNDAVVTVGIVDFNAAIRSYPSFTYSAKVGTGTVAAGVNDTTCPICISEYVESEMMRMMPQCGHYFHLNCLDEWLKINWSCPVCRDSPLQQAEPPSCS